MGFGKSTRKIHFSENRLTAQQTRKQRKKGMYSKTRSAETQVYLSESYPFKLLNSTASTRNGGRAKKKIHDLLREKCIDKVHKNEENVPLSLLDNCRSTKPFFGNKDWKIKQEKKACRMGERRRWSHSETLPNPKEQRENTVKNWMKPVKNDSMINVKPFKKNFNDHITERKIKLMKQSQELKPEEYLKALVQAKGAKSALKLYKLVGVESRSVRDVHLALINFFKLDKKELGGLHYLECSSCWVFFANPTAIEQNSHLSANNYGIRISEWMPEEVERVSANLINLACEISKNKKELKSVRKAAKLLFKAFEEKNPKALEDVISLTSNLNKKISFYFFKNIKSFDISKRRYSGSILIIPEHLWDENKTEEREAYIKKYKLKSQVKNHKKNTPRRQDPGRSL